MGRLHEIRVKSDRFISQIDLNIEEAIQSNEATLVKMNISQMLNHTDSEGNPLIHKKTGSPLLSPAYAKIKNKSRPNLKDTGEFQKNMFLLVNNNKWFIDSEDPKAGFLVGNYGKIFGIEDKQEAKRTNLKSFAALYKKEVLR